jgi:hypothetical protein
MKSIFESEMQHFNSVSCVLNIRVLIARDLYFLKALHKALCACNFAFFMLNLSRFFIFLWLFFACYNSGCLFVLSWPPFFRVYFIKLKLLAKAVCGLTRVQWHLKEVCVCEWVKNLCAKISASPHVLIFMRSSEKI